MPKNPGSFKLQGLSRALDRDSFDCGIEALNLYLQKHALQSDKRSAARTFVLTSSENPKKILGYYTLVNAVISFEELPDTYAKKYRPKMPGVNLARLAVDTNEQGNAYGSFLLIHALKDVLAISELSGAAACFVDAKDGARDFYIDYGFIPLISNENRLFLPTKTISKLINNT